MECEIRWLRDLGAEQQSERNAIRESITSKYAHACPDADLVTEIIEHPTVELGAGSGYWARLLRDRGGDIVAIDNWSWNEPSEKWSQVDTGDESALARHGDRTLLLVMPPRPSGERIIRSWEGATLTVVTTAGFPSEGLHETATEEGRWVFVHRRPLPEVAGWPRMEVTTWER
jgi:hypothetical protein